jgi:GNAT superfamily N-acetyltransferase
MLLRPAVPGEALAISRVHVRSWQAAYRGLLPDEYLDGLRAEERAEKYDFTNPDKSAPQTIVAEVDGLIVGFATTSRSQDASLADFGELCALYVDPVSWGRGYGLALAAEAQSRLVTLGFEDALLWILKGNVRADRFYRNDGWQPDGAEKSEMMWGTQVVELRDLRHVTFNI